MEDSTWSIWRLRARHLLRHSTELRKSAKLIFVRKIVSCNLGTCNYHLALSFWPPGIRGFSSLVLNQIFLLAKVERRQGPIGFFWTGRLFFWSSIFNRNKVFCEHRRVPYGGFLNYTTCQKIFSNDILNFHIFRFFEVSSSGKGPHF